MTPVDFRADRVIAAPRAMKQEQRLVAEVYRFLAPFVDTKQDIYVSLDGQAAQNAVKQGILIDSAIPDLWFTFVGAKRPTLIEVKIVRDGKIMLMQSQLSAWRSSGDGAHKPDYWIASDIAFTTFYLWTHASFLDRLDTTVARTVTILRRLPQERWEFTGVAELALNIIRHSTKSQA